jgi:hypothetical protein
MVGQQQDRLAVVRYLQGAGDYSFAREFRCAGAWQDRAFQA